MKGTYIIYTNIFIIIYILIIFIHDYTYISKSNRYYHLFKKGELDDLVDQIKIGKVVETGYDRDNWYVIAERI